MSVLSREKWDALLNKKTLSGEAALEAVTQYGYALQYVKDQTEEICLAAVTQNGDALKYVTKQTREICLTAVTKYSFALQYVEERFLDNDNSCHGKVVEVDGKKYKLAELWGQ
jgi:hypothetical protein